MGAGAAAGLVGTADEEAAQLVREATDGSERFHAAGIDVLFVHPHGHLSDERIIPSGAITCLNFFPGAKVGVPSWKLTQDMILAARVVVLDLFWASAYLGVAATIERIRGLRSDVPILMSGFTASMLQQSVLKTLDIDGVFAGLDVERRFVDVVLRLLSTSPPRRRKLARALCAGNPDQMAPDRDALDPVSLDWLDSEHHPDRVNLHLTRGCANRSRECNPCAVVLSRCLKSGWARPLYSAAYLRELVARCPLDSLQLWSNGMSIPHLEELFLALSTWETTKHIHVNTCGWLPVSHPAVSGTPFRFPFATDHAVSVDLYDWQDRGGAEEQARRLRCLIQSGEPDAGVLVYAHGPVSAPMAHWFERRGVDWRRIQHVLNWKFLDDLKDTAQDLRRVMEFSLVAQRALPLRILCPGLWSYSQVWNDVQTQMPDPLPRPGGVEFSESLHRGFERWGTILPDSIRYTMVGLHWRGGQRPSLHGSLVRPPVVERVSGSEPVEMQLEVTGGGWRLRLLREAPDGDVVGIIPGVLSESSSVDGLGMIRVFQRTHGEMKTLDIQGPFLRWDDGSWVDVRETDRGILRDPYTYSRNGSLLL